MLLLLQQFAPGLWQWIIATPALAYVTLGLAVVWTGLELRARLPGERGPLVYIALSLAGFAVCWYIDSYWWAMAVLVAGLPYLTILENRAREEDLIRGRGTN